MPQKLTHEDLIAAIAGFEAQKNHIDSQIAEIRQMLDGGSAVPAVTPSETGKRKRKFSAASRRKMAAAQKARWAEIKKAESSQSAMSETPKPKRKVSRAARKRMAEAQKARWAKIKKAA